MDPSDSYRPAARALKLGLVALALRAAAVGIVFLMKPEPPSGVWGSDESGQSLNLALGISSSLTDFIATCLGLIGVGYSAIASHRREWGVVLVLAWIVSVLAALADLHVILGFCFPVG